MASRLSVCFVLLFVFSLLHPENANASIIFSDDFSSTGLEQWTIVRNRWWENPNTPCSYLGNPTTWTAQNGKLQMRIDGPPCVTEILPDVEIPEESGLVFEFEMSFPSWADVDRNYLLKWKDPLNFYGIHILGQQISIEKIVQGVGYALLNSNTTYPFQANQTYTFKNVVSHEGMMQIWINGDKVIETFDQQPVLLEGTPGFRASVGAIPYSDVLFDAVRITLIPSGASLPVPYFAQVDPAWSDLKYDTASRWSPEKSEIARWGCALTSAVMVFRYYGLNTLPSGEMLTPGSLNAWLYEQSDGFIGDGLVNWIALTRLSYQLAQRNGTPVLEYARYPYSMPPVVQHIDLQRPLILGLIGHFVVVRGYNAEQTSPEVADPADPSKRWLTENDHPTALIAFAPSQTDLSYLLFVLPDESRILPVENHPGNISYAEPTLNDDLEAYPRTIKNTQLLEIPKPDSGNYRFLFTGNDSQDTTLSVFTYTTSGEVQHFSLRVPASVNPQELTINYVKDRPTSVVSLVHPNSLIDLLITLRENHALPNSLIYYKLLRVANYIAQSWDTSTSKRYLMFFRTTLDSDMSIPFDVKTQIFALLDMLELRKN